MDSALTTMFLGHRVEVLKRIASDFKLDESALLAKYADPAPINMICTWKSNRGTLCTNHAMCGFAMCNKHHGKKVTTKRKRIVMVHNHKIGETPQSVCELCEMFGNPLDPIRPELEIM